MRCWRPDPGAARRLAALVALVLVTAGRASGEPDTAAGEAVRDWRQAGECVGRVCAVRGTVAAVRDDGPVIRLYFDAAQRDVYVTLVRGWFVTWPDYAGRTIVATGRVDRFRDQTEMMVRDPDHIALLDAPPAPPPAILPPAAVVPTPAADAAAAPVPPSTPAAAVTSPATAPAAADPAAAEMDQLRRRIRELEERVQELEALPPP